MDGLKPYTTTLPGNAFPTTTQTMIITSLLDTDLYKFTMMQVVLHQFPGAQVEYRFKCRNAHTKPASGNAGFDLAPFANEIREEIRSLCSLQFHEEDLAYLRGMRFIKSDFMDFLGIFRLNEKYIAVTALPNGEIDISIQGPWLHTILFEIPVLAIVNEVYFRNTCKAPDLAEGRRRLDIKIAQLRSENLGDLKIADYGTRRRFSKVWHEEVLRELATRLGTAQSPGHEIGTPGQLAGTSNVLFAKKLGLTPLGTMAHEYLQACQALGPRLRDSQIYGFESWAREYRGDLGIALSDVYGMDAFLRDFDMYFCKLFDGARHDSGDPFNWGERMLAHYASNRVDPRTKILIFSDGLTVPRTIELYRRFRGRCQLAFGIGTNLTNDLGYEPLQIVIKMVRCNGQPVAKLSDTPSKNMCDDERYLAYLRQVFEIPQVA
jgi:nicotinate phosphoribosyltransferase